MDSLGGRYITAEDVGSSVADRRIIGHETPHVRGTLETGGGDPSPVTAFGVYQGVRAAVKHKLGRDDLSGIHVAVQGLGHVGAALCRRLADDGTRLTIADIDTGSRDRVAAELSASVVAPDEIMRIEADVFAPCALGAVLNDKTIPEFKVAIVAGAANNQLAEDRHGASLHKRGIHYVPDYAINAGGIINIFYEGPSYDREQAMPHTARLYETLLELFARAQAEGLPTNETADHLAEERVLSQWDWRPGDPVVG